MEENSITIIIQGHGSENTYPSVSSSSGDKFPLNGLQLLSYSGMPNVAGRMSYCPIRKMSVDMEVMKLLQDFYSFKEPHFQYFEKYNQEQLLKSTIDYLKFLYESYSIDFPTGFRITHPISERSFQLFPNKHENCSTSCIDKRDENGNEYKRCIEVRDKKKVHCPVYGLYVAKSSNPYDLPFTLCGTTIEKANMNETLSTMDYWLSRCSNEEWRNYMHKLIYENRIISLTQIYDIFSEMGFTKIYIHDPTCRSYYSDIESSIPPSAISQLRNSTRRMIGETRIHSYPVLSVIVSDAMDQEKDRKKIQKLQDQLLQEQQLQHQQLQEQQLQHQQLQEQQLQHIDEERRKILKICISTGCFLLLLNSGLLEQLMHMLGIKGGRKKQRTKKRGGVKHQFDELDSDSSSSENNVTNIYENEGNIIFVVNGQEFGFDKESLKEQLIMQTAGKKSNKKIRTIKRKKTRYTYQK
jgi:hypothetical protein